MFAASRWAAAFVAECGTESAREGLDFLKAVIPVIRAKAVYMAGTTAARQVDAFLARALSLAGGGDPPIKSGGDREITSGGDSVRVARAVVFFLIKRKLFQYADRVVAAIEQTIDAQERILRVELECSGEAEGKLTEKLKETLSKIYHAKGVRVITRKNEALLGGYRLFVRGAVYDYSIAGELAELGARLSVKGAV